VYAAFRYLKKPGDTPGVGLAWTRFPDARELSAVAQQATVTTLVTSEGRSLTEVKLTLKNQSQPFVKVDLPAGASILSADVDGEKVKPAQGADGSRIPLLRPGFRPHGAYTVSFVFLHSGTPFPKKGTGAIELPRMDIPIGVVQWEVFLPRQYAVNEFGGDAMAANLLPATSDITAFAELRDSGPGETLFALASDNGGKALIDFKDLAVINSGAAYSPNSGEFEQYNADRAGAAHQIGRGQIGGLVVDPAQGTVANATVTVRSNVTGATQTTTTDSSGYWSIAGLPAGSVRVTATSPGFRSFVRDASISSSSPTTMSMKLEVGATMETIEVTSGADKAKNKKASVDGAFQRVTVAGGGGPGGGVNEDQRRQNAANSPASQNVVDLQKRVAGVLPIAIDVPHAGASYHFVRPLVVSEVTHLTFNYKTTK
jgi:hypothetical protein